MPSDETSAIVDRWSKAVAEIDAERKARAEEYQVNAVQVNGRKFYRCTHRETGLGMQAMDIDAGARMLCDTELINREQSEELAPCKPNSLS